MKHWYIFILMLLLPIETYSKGQRQNDFQTLVEKYQQKLATSITMLCAHNYDNELFKLGWKKMEERQRMEKKLESNGLLKTFRWRW